MTDFCEICKHAITLEDEYREYWNDYFVHVKCEEEVTAK